MDGLWKITLTLDGEKLILLSFGIFLGLSAYQLRFFSFVVGYHRLSKIGNDI